MGSPGFTSGFMMRTVLLIILVFCVVSFLFCLSLFFVLCSLLSVSLDYPTLFVSTIFSNLYCHLIIYDTATHIISICSFQDLRLIETTWLVLLLAISPRVRYIVGSSPVGSNQRQCNFFSYCSTKHVTERKNNRLVGME